MNSKEKFGKLIKEIYKKIPIVCYYKQMSELYKSHLPTLKDTIKKEAQISLQEVEEYIDTIEKKMRGDEVSYIIITRVAMPLTVTLASGSPYVGFTSVCLMSYFCPFDLLFCRWAKNRIKSYQKSLK
ncbi:MAG: hypothetical protein H3Z52_13755 [archaeon]|nr:hypothetical protein [archaeon]